jgi:predicted GTPase
MIVPAPQPNVQNLQQEAIALFKEISFLMDNAASALSTDSSSDKYKDFQQEVLSVSHNVEKLELMMAIVAPMKAGKSTIINAIAGQEILPSRNAAMTTLPTQIIFNSDLTQPTLTDASGFTNKDSNFGNAAHPRQDRAISSFTRFAAQNSRPHKSTVARNNLWTRGNYSGIDEFERYRSPLQYH